MLITMRNLLQSEQSPDTYVLLLNIIIGWNCGAATVTKYYGTLSLHSKVNIIGENLSQDIGDNFHKLISKLFHK